MTTENTKSLPLAIGLNLVLPGAGYMYMGRVVLGLAAMLLVIAVVAGAGLILLVPVWLGFNAIMAIDMVILFNKRKAADEANSTRECPFCAERIRIEATVCKHCQRDLPPPA